MPRIPRTALSEPRRLITGSASRRTRPTFAARQSAPSTDAAAAAPSVESSSPPEPQKRRAPRIPRTQLPTWLPLPPKRSEALVEAAVKAADPAYVPATSIEGLEKIPSLKTWWNQPGNWTKNLEFAEKFGPRQKISDLAVVEVCLRQALIEALALKDSSHLPEMMARPWAEPDGTLRGQALKLEPYVEAEQKFGPPPMRLRLAEGKTRLKALSIYETDELNLPKRSIELPESLGEDSAGQALSPEPYVEKEQDFGPPFIRLQVAKGRVMLEKTDELSVEEIDERNLRKRSMELSKILREASRLGALNLEPEVEEGQDFGPPIMRLFLRKPSMELSESLREDGAGSKRGKRGAPAADGTSNEHQLGSQKILPSVAKKLIAKWDPEWKEVALHEDIKFAVRKRLFQMTGIYLADSRCGASRTIRDMLTFAAQPLKPVKLAKQLDGVENYRNLPNVKLYKRRVGLIDKEKMVGRWKLIEAELAKRGLPSRGVGGAASGKELPFFEGRM